MKECSTVIARRPLGRRSNPKRDCFGCLRQPRNDIIVILSILLISSLSFAQGNNEEAEFIFAKKAFTDGFYALAQENIEDFLIRYPETSHLYEAHILLGRSFYYQNNLKKAAYEFDIILNAPSIAALQDSALYWTGDIYYRAGDFKSALEHYQKVIDEYPASRYLPYAVYSKAWSYYRLGFLEDAASVFGDCVSRYPLEKIAMESLFKIGEIEYLAGRYEEAKNALNNFMERYSLSERTAEGYYLLGDINLRQQNYADALVFFKRALSISPGASWAGLASFGMARAYFKLGDFDEGIRYFESCLKEPSGPLEASSSLLGLAYCYEKKAMIDEALKACDRISAEFPRTDTAAESYYLKARILYDDNKMDKAEEACLKGIDKFLSPYQTGKIHYILGWIYLKMERNKDALTQFSQAAKNAKDDIFISSAMCKIGDIYLEGKEYALAAESFNESLKNYPDSPWSDYAQYRVGGIFLAAKKYDPAVLSYQSLLANFPNTALRDKAIFRLGMAYFGKGAFREALAEFERLAKLSPGYNEYLPFRFYTANSLYNLNRCEEALEIFKSLANNTLDRDIAMRAQYQAGWCYYRMGREMEAADSFDIFLKKYPDSEYRKDVLDKSASILLTAAQNFEKWKMPDDAARVYKRLEELKR